MAGDKNKNSIWNLLLSLLASITIFQQNYHDNQLVVTPNEMAGLYCRDQPLNNAPPFSSCLSPRLVPSTRIFLPSYLHVLKAGPRTKIHYTPGLEKLFLDNCKVLRSVQCYETTATLDSFLQIKLITKAEQKTLGGPFLPSTKRI